MTKCCEPESASASNRSTVTKHSKSNCPSCQKKCHSVSLVSLLQQLIFPKNMNISDNTFYYCGNVHCDTVYFSDAGKYYSVLDLREQSNILSEKLCYCFDITKNQFQQALNLNQASVITDFVKKQTKMQNCACEYRNPSGRCCLADFKKIERTNGALEKDTTNLMK